MVCAVDSDESFEREKKKKRHVNVSEECGTLLGHYFLSRMGSKQQNEVNVQSIKYLMSVHTDLRCVVLCFD